MKLPFLNSEEHFKRGANFYQTEEFEKALQEFKKVEKLDPENETNLFYLGLTYQELKDFSLALKYFERALQIDQNFLACHLHLGLLLAEEWISSSERGEEDTLLLNKAIVEYRTVLRIDSKNEEAQEFLPVLEGYLK